MQHVFATLTVNRHFIYQYKNASTDNSLKNLKNNHLSNKTILGDSTDAFVVNKTGQGLIEKSIKIILTEMPLMYSELKKLPIEISK